jgi:hypothetical protein
VLESLLLVEEEIRRLTHYLLIKKLNQQASKQAMYAAIGRYQKQQKPRKTG